MLGLCDGERGRGREGEREGGRGERREKGGEAGEKEKDLEWRQEKEGHESV